MRRATKIGLAVFIVLLLIGGVGYAFYYTYSNIQISLRDISLSNIELKPNWQTVYYGIIGNLLQAVLSIVHFVDLDVAVEIDNPGFLPVVVPSFDYMLYCNDIEMGPGSYQNSISVPAGSSKTIHITQKIVISSMQELIASIVSNGGVLDVKIVGRIHFRMLPIDIPFHITKSINVYDVIWNKIKDLIGISGDRIPTSVIMEKPPSSVYEDQAVTFTGRLVRADTVAGIGGVTITIYDNDPVGDDFMASTITDNDGRFSVTWIAKPMDEIDRTVEVYAKFEGTDTFDKSQSNQYTISIEAARKTRTILTLDQPASSIVEGSSLIFTGRLVKADDGAGIADALIKIYDSDVGPDDLIISGETDSNGRFRLEWTAKRMDPLDRTVEVYAKFDGTENMEPSKSPQTEYYVITVEPSEKVKTTLILNPPLDEVKEGSTVTFTGKLIETDTGIPVAGATIKIYDSDVDFDDFVISATTGSDGTFSVEWTAKKMDWWDNNCEIYAKFEGSTFYEPSKSNQYTITVS